MCLNHFKAVKSFSQFIKLSGHISQTLVISMLYVLAMPHTAMRCDAGWVNGMF